MANCLTAKNLRTVLNLVDDSFIPDIIVTLIQGVCYNKQWIPQIKEDVKKDMERIFEAKTPSKVKYSLTKDLIDRCVIIIIVFYEY